MILVKNTQRKIAINTNTFVTKARRMLAALGYSGYTVNIWLTTNATIRKFNKQYRKKDKATDILSFPYHQLQPGEKIKPESPEEENLGDIMISLEYVQKDAPKWDQTFKQRMDVLLAHGIAHLLGYDHKTEEEYKVMNKLEKKLLKTISS